MFEYNRVSGKCLLTMHSHFVFHQFLKNHSSAQMYYIQYLTHSILQLVFIPTEWLPGRLYLVSFVQSSSKNFPLYKYTPLSSRLENDSFLASFLLPLSMPQGHLVATTRSGNTGIVRYCTLNIIIKMGRPIST